MKFTPAKHTRDIISAAVEPFGLTYKDVMKRDRHRNVVAARRAAIEAVHVARPHMSYPELGRLFGLDHSTIMHHLGLLRQFVDRSHSDPVVHEESQGQVEA